jgi:protochlorophyllide reductase
LAANDSTKGIIANCFSPGLITSTGFFRNQNPVFSKVFDFAVTKLAKVGETPEWGGAALAYMTTVDTRGDYYNSPPGSSKYGNEALGREFTINPTSKEAQDDAEAKKLWELSEKLVGITA